MKQWIAVTTALALAAGAVPTASAGAQGAQGGTRGRAADTTARAALVRARLAEHEVLVRRLRELERRLHDEGISSSARTDLVEEIGNLSLRLADLGTRFAVEIAPRVTAEMLPQLETEMRRGMIEANRVLREEGVFHRFAPKGWVGLHLEGDTQLWVRDGEMFMRYADHPFVVSVDPNSPAERAGVRRGDQVLSYNGHDVRSMLPVSRIFQPGAKIAVRVKRDERPQEIMVTAVTAPQMVRERRPLMIAPMSPAPVVTVRPSRAPEPPRVVTSGTPRAPRVMVHTGPEGQTLYSFETGHWKGNPAIVGAQLQELTDDMAEVIGVKRGLLVTLVYPGTVAAEAGLRQGDVIARVGEREVTTIATLFAGIAVERQRSPSSTPLEVVRKGKTRKIALKWD